LYLPKHEYLNRHKAYNDEKKKLRLQRTYDTTTNSTKSRNSIYKQHSFLQDKQVEKWKINKININLPKMEEAGGL